MYALSYDYYPNPSRHPSCFSQLLRENPTPVFLAERAILEDRYFTLKRVLERCWPDHVIAYSFKTNYLVAQSKLFQELGAWAEVVSGREYQMAKQLGYSGDRIVFNGPYKTDAQLLQALGDHAALNVNDHEELRRLEVLAAREEGQHPVGLRVSTTITGMGHSRFGFSMESDEARRAVEKVLSSSRLRLVGLHMHLLGDTDDPARYREAGRKLGQFIRRHLPDQGRSLRYVDLGGGFPAHGPKPHRRTEWDPRPIEEYVEAISEELSEIFPQGDRPTLILEPGRYLVCDGIIFVAQVVNVRHSGQRQRITSNGSITMMPLTHYCPHIVQAFAPTFAPRVSEGMTSTIYGPSCREDDILLEGPFPEVEIGDYLVHYAVGAYNSNLSPSFIFDTPPVVFF